jgi:5-formyltetrahydrofolate cyclo-ligase
LKKDLRKKLLKKRDRIGPEEKKIKEAAIRKRFYASADFKKAKSILLYASFRSEVDTLQCIKHALELNKVVILPRVEKRAGRMRLFQIHNLDDLEPGYMGIPEPAVKRAREKRLRDIDMVVVPGAGFDTNGNRLGYGAGYYDKLLSGSGRHIVTAALAFEEQIARKVPGEEHDVRMDKIMTEKRTINCKIRKGIRGKEGESL